MENKLSYPSVKVIDDVTDRIELADKYNLLETQIEYENVVNQMAILRLNKVKDFGEDRYKIDDMEFQLWMMYCDAWRKFIRLKKLTKDSIDGDPNAIKKLRQDMMDMANYGIMAVQLIDKFKWIEKNNNVEKAVDELREKLHNVVVDKGYDIDDHEDNHVADEVEH